MATRHYRLVIATNNPGKLREFEQLLAGCGFELTTPRELGVAFDPIESGSTFAENATIKAVEAMRLTGMPALADDSGLEVDYLGGRPGIFSARYAGGDRTASDVGEQEQCEIVLRELADVPDEERTARFICVIAIALPGQAVQTVDGVFEGRIAQEVRGEHGFGYDPIFLVPELGVTSAELATERKNAISHRAQAALKACELLRRMQGDTATV
jgi:XTP/dITP diphosphohydrolase